MKLEFRKKQGNWLIGVLIAVLVCLLGIIGYSIWAILHQNQIDGTLVMAEELLQRWPML